MTSLDVAPVREERAADILSDDALEFLAELHGRFEPRRQELLRARKERGAPSGFLEETREIRDGDWQVVAPPADYHDRRVEITGPTDRKLVINALNSGAKGFMADFEDANSPTWANQVEGHVNLIDAIERTITYDATEGKHYELNDEVATLLVRPRGWHLPEKHLRVDGDTLAGALMDFGLYFFHNAQRLIDHGTGPYLYLPKMEHHLEARLWNDVFTFSEEAVGVPHGTIRATVLIETLPAAFQMDEILYELREHSMGLNAGRWDYIFSMIKCFRDRPEFVLPDRNDVTMTVPFMRAYTELLVKTCHARGAFAMGGMAAQIPSRKDAEANEKALAKAAEDKKREAEAGFDGTWVAHPDVGRDRHGRVRQGAPRQAEPDRQAAARRRRDARAAARRGVHPGRRHRGGPAQRRLGRLPVHLVLARRPRRRGHQQPDGGRRHRRDLALADLAVGPPRQVHARARRRGARGGDGQDPRRRRRRDVAEGPARRDARDLRARRAGRRLPRLPDAARPTSTSTEREATRRGGAGPGRRVTGTAPLTSPVGVAPSGPSTA